MILAILLSLTLDAPAARPKASPRPSPSPVVVVPPDFPPEEAEVRALEPDFVPALEPDFVPALQPTPCPSPTPTPVPPPSLITLANRKGPKVQTELGMVVTPTDDETSVLPTIWIDTDSPIPVGDGKSLGRFGVHLGLSSSPGQDLSFTDVKTFRSLQADFRLGRVVGVLGSTYTTLLAEFGFADRMSQPAGDHQSRSLGAGIMLTAKIGYLLAKYGYDEASATCRATVDCSDFNSGPAFMFRGQVSIYKGTVIFGGEATLATGQKVSWLERRDIKRIFVTVDPVATYKMLKEK